MTQLPAPPLRVAFLSRPVTASGARQLGFTPMLTFGYWALPDADTDVVLCLDEDGFSLWLGEANWPLYSVGGLIRRMKQLTGVRR